jgi:hypothetical protein
LKQNKWRYWLDAALAVPFLLSTPPTAIVQNARLPQNESGVKPPHSKTAQTLPGGSTQNKNRITEIGLDKFEHARLCLFVKVLAPRGKRAQVVTTAFPRTAGF